MYEIFKRLLAMAEERLEVIDCQLSSYSIDMSDEWIHICTIFSTNLRSFSIPVRPRRCDYMKLRIVGEGMAKIYSYTKTIEQGSDRS